MLMIVYTIRIILKIKNLQEKLKINIFVLSWLYRRWSLSSNLFFALLQKKLLEKKAQEKRMSFLKDIRKY